MTDGAFKFHKMWRYVQLSEPYKVQFESCYGPEKILNFYAQILLKDWPFMHCQTSLTCLPVAEDLEVGEEHEEADGDVGVLDGEMDDVDIGHVDDAEAAVQHHQLVQEGAGLLLQDEVDQRRVGGDHQHRGHPPQHLAHTCERPLLYIAKGLYYYNCCKKIRNREGLQIFFIKENCLRKVNTVIP